ncbi:hypothetical protein HNQ99_001470 [Rhizorhapis suberifaciens]|uniref:Uncharacterized protein n=1 Tax=Rhizorhapis suberifaciens TaxID=13656 RepID=A0A840HT32_9SPHN|nr:hypothetical protein [Rhizorhapis suberifaciens]
MPSRPAAAPAPCSDASSAEMADGVNISPDTAYPSGGGRLVVQVKARS